MPKILCVVILVFLAPLAAWGETDGAPILFEPFKADVFDEAETRLLQTALTAEGDFSGQLTGQWETDSQAALEEYAWREFVDSPLNLHAAALVVTFLDSIEENGWTLRHFDDLGITMALPERAMAGPEPEDGGQRWWSRAGSLTALTHRFDWTEAKAWHDAAITANADPSVLYKLRFADRLVTAGYMADGRVFFTRSDRVGEHWATVFLASDDDDMASFNLMRTSIQPGAPAVWELTSGGRLEHLVDATLDLVGSIEEDEGLSAPENARLPGSAFSPATGTGFFVNDRVMVTAQHVVGGCEYVGLADGTELHLIAEDAALDVAILTTSEPSDTWISLSSGAETRLGQRVHAMGFPYYGIAGTSLHMTGGNVSALVGVNDDRRFFSFTAPVQPGNSGGPLISRDGAVLGLVVSRLSDRFIEEATGTLPQNINYALDKTELFAFLEQHGVDSPSGGLAQFDMEAGVPPAISSAVLPVLCD